jgi:hypothetical protein
LIEARLELVRNDEEAIGVGLEALGDLATRKAVEVSLTVLLPCPSEVVLAREGDNRLVGTLALREIGVEGTIVGLKGAKDEISAR